jgi:hypothetical protein
MGPSAEEKLIKISLKNSLFQKTPYLFITFQLLSTLSLVAGPINGDVEHQLLADLHFPSATIADAALSGGVFGLSRRVDFGDANSTTITAGQIMEQVAKGGSEMRGQHAARRFRSIATIRRRAEKLNSEARNFMDGRLGAST